MFGGNFAPIGWAECNGQLLSISQNAALFSLLGTTYGGNGTTTFALPNLQGATPMGQGQGPGLQPRDLGETGGTTFVTLNESQLPGHTHSAVGTTTKAKTADPAGAVWAGAAERGGALYSDATSGLVSMSSTALAPTGGGGSLNNLPPYLTVTFIIALVGVYPPRS